MSTPRWPGSRRSTIATCTDAPAALLAVERRGAGHAIGGLRRGERLAPRVLDVGQGAVHACVLPTQAGPLAGDHDRLRIVVGAGATLVVRPVAATVALPGAGRTRLDLDVCVGRGGRLVFEEAPLIVAAGADVERTARVELAAGAVAALRDVVVLGRCNEPRGRLASTLRVSDPFGLVLHDALRLDPAHEDARVALAPGDRVVGTLCLFGLEPADDRDRRIARGGALRRATAHDLAEVESRLAEPWARWSSTVCAHGAGAWSASVP